MEMLQAEMAGAFYILQFLKWIGIFVGVIGSFYLIGETITKIRQDKEKKSK